MSSKKNFRERKKGRKKERNRNSAGLKKEQKQKNF